MKRDFIYWLGGSMFEMILVLIATRFANFILYGYFQNETPIVALIIGRLFVGAITFFGAKIFDILCKHAEEEVE